MKRFAPYVSESRQNLHQEEDTDGACLQVSQDCDHHVGVALIEMGTRPEFRISKKLPRYFKW